MSSVGHPDPAKIPKTGLIIPRSAKVGRVRWGIAFLLFFAVLVAVTLVPAFLGALLVGRAGRVAAAARRLGKADVPGDDALEHLGPEVLARVGGRRGRVPLGVILHGRDGQRRMKEAFDDAVSKLVSAGQALP